MGYLLTCHIDYSQQINKENPKFYDDKVCELDHQHNNPEVYLILIVSDFRGGEKPSNSHQICDELFSKNAHT